MRQYGTIAIVGFTSSQREDLRLFVKRKFRVDFALLETLHSEKVQSALGELIGGRDTALLARLAVGLGPVVASPRRLPLVECRLLAPPLAVLLGGVDVGDAVSSVVAVLHLLNGRVAHPCVGDARTVGHPSNCATCGHPSNRAARTSASAGAAAAGEPATEAEEQAEEPESRAPIARILTSFAVDAHEDVGAARREERLESE